MTGSYMEKRLKSGPLADIYGKVEAGVRLSFEDGVRLYQSPDVNGVGYMANLVRERMHGDLTYYNVNSHINYSNVCVLWKACKFCAFARKEGQEGAYEYSLQEIFQMAETLGKGRTEFHMVGGLHPDLPLDYYLEMIHGIKEIHPHLHLKCFTSTEIRHKGGNAYEMDGKLKLRGVEKAVTVPFTLDINGTAASAKGEVDLIRTDFGVGQGQFEKTDQVAGSVKVVFEFNAKKVE